MKTIKNSKDITTLEVGDVVVFGDLKYEVATYTFSDEYYLDNLIGANDAIFEHLNINKRAFIENLGINADYHCDFPEVCSLEALTAIVSALFKEYEKQNKQPTYEEVCEKLFEKEHYFTNVRGELRHAVNMANDCPNNASSEHQLECILAKNKLANVARYLNGEWKWDLGSHDAFFIMDKSYKENTICLYIDEYTCYSERANVLFKSKEAAQQAIEILGEETVKLALEPLY